LFLAVATLGFALACSSYFLNGDYYHWIPNGSIQPPRNMVTAIPETTIMFMYSENR